MPAGECEYGPGNTCIGDDDKASVPRARASEGARDTSPVVCSHEDTEASMTSGVHLNKESYCLQSHGNFGSWCPSGWLSLRSRW